MKSACPESVRRVNARAILNKALRSTARFTSRCWTYREESCLSCKLITQYKHRQLKGGFDEAREAHKARMAFVAGCGLALHRMECSRSGSGGRLSQPADSLY